jgi:hypothetical protein
MQSIDLPKKEACNPYKKAKKKKQCNYNLPNLYDALGLSFFSEK